MSLFLSPISAAQTTDYYPLTIGSKWTYRVTASGAGQTVEKTMQVEITGKESAGGMECYMKKYTMDNRIVQEECYGWQDGKLILYKGAVDQSGSLVHASPSPPQVLLVTPLEAGVKWTWTGDIGTEKDTLQGEVGGRTLIVVPAGVFDAYLVTLTLTIQSSYQSIGFSRWFADGVGMVKQTESIPYAGTLVAFSNELTYYEIPGGKTSLYSLLPLALAILVVGLIAGLVLVRKRRGKTGRTVSVSETPHELQQVCAHGVSTKEYCSDCEDEMVRRWNRF